MPTPRTQAQPVPRRTATPARASVAVCVDDPDLAEDCLAAVRACGLAATTAELAGLSPGTPLMFYDAGAYERAGEAAEPACRIVDRAVPVCSDLTPRRPGGRRALALPSETSTLLRLLDGAAGADSGGRHVLVAGAHGGAGASTFACVAALRAARRSEPGVVLVEADARGPGLDLLLGMESEPGLRLGGVHAGAGTLDPDQLWTALPRHGGLAVAAAEASVDGMAGTGEGPDWSTPLAVAHAGVAGGRLVVTDAGPASAVPEAFLRAADVVALVSRSTLAGMLQTLREAPRLAAHAAALVVVLRGARTDSLGAGDLRPQLDAAGRRSGFSGAAVPICTFSSNSAIARTLDGGGTLRPSRGLAAAADQVLSGALDRGGAA
ncbi:hypothetical protein [Dietzia timorensis]|uniref:CobQ/CobB/MinD/ParA nucleotide binding domain-containing protein n=1 Tax=Dietzia timorensis TaxID=499555 RepID=A0A173LGJ1_9ACTN|nr:hypothetical protein [Dietzia timorensis]ANI91355.1 Hypothetical protein BJL86_0552 [Dietzia timorensis]